jgi:hypothetical protein
MAKKEEKKAEESVSSVEEVKGSTFPASMPIRADQKTSVPMFQVLVVGTEARVYGKTGLPVSPILPLSEASVLASRFNSRDPEQNDARGKQDKKVVNRLADEANGRA